MVEALKVPVVRDADYPYDESPSLDVVISYITRSSIQWGSDPRITSAELTETAYLFFRIVCHSLCPISHFHTIPLERCVFLYAFASGASISFPHLFLCSLNEVHRSSAIGHALIHPIFIHRILLHLSLDGFPSGEPVHVIAPIGATFLCQRAAQLRVAPPRPRGASSSSIPPPPFSLGTAATETSGAAADADFAVPPLTATDDSDIRRTLDHVLTVQAAQGQILVNVLYEIRALRAELAQFRPPPF